MNFSLSILFFFGLINNIFCRSPLVFFDSPACPALKPMENFDLNKVILSIDILNYITIKLILDF